MKMNAASFSIIFMLYIYNKPEKNFVTSWKLIRIRGRYTTSAKKKRYISYDGDKKFVKERRVTKQKVCFGGVYFK